MVHIAIQAALTIGRPILAHGAKLAGPVKAWASKLFARFLGNPKVNGAVYSGLHKLSRKGLGRKAARASHGLGARLFGAARHAKGKTMRSALKVAGTQSSRLGRRLGALDGQFANMANRASALVPKTALPRA